MNDIRVVDKQTELKISSKTTKEVVEELLNSEEWEEVNSSWISKLLYKPLKSNPNTGVLFIKYRSNKGIDYVVIHSEVSSSLYKGLLLADSKGKYYHYYIKSKCHVLKTIKLTSDEDIEKYSSLPSIEDLKSGYFSITKAG